MTHNAHEVLLPEIGGTAERTKGDEKQREKIEVGGVVRLKDFIEHLFDEERYDTIGGTKRHHAEQSPDKGATVRLEKLREPLLQHSTGWASGSRHLKHESGDLISGGKGFAKSAIFGDWGPFKRMTDRLKGRVHRCTILAIIEYPGYLSNNRLGGTMTLQQLSHRVGAYDIDERDFRD
jgi:hypothetical protein